MHTHLNITCCHVIQGGAAHITATALKHKYCAEWGGGVRGVYRERSVDKLKQVF